MVQMTTEQLQQLIEAVRVSAANSAAGGAVAGTSKKSLSFCPAAFHGDRDHEVVEEFITAVVTYKEVEGISDEDALRSISLRFCGTASTWWQGVRKEAKTWGEAIALIREHFSPTKPSYQVYMEIFEKKQSERTAIDTFVCQKRALYALLPEGRHDEETELDFTYGLLNLKYRKHISRHDVSSFRELLEKGRIIEHNNMEDEQLAAAKRAGPVRGAKNPKRCTYCNFRGHTADQCRKRKASAENVKDEHEEADD